MFLVLLLLLLLLLNILKHALSQPVGESQEQGESKLLYYKHPVSSRFYICINSKNNENNILSILRKCQLKIYYIHIGAGQCNVTGTGIRYVNGHWTTSLSRCLSYGQIYLLTVCISIQQAEGSDINKVFLQSGF